MNLAGALRVLAPILRRSLRELVQGARDETPLQFSVHRFTQETDKARKERKETHAVVSA